MGVDWGLRRCWPVAGWGVGEGWFGVGLGFGWQTIAGWFRCWVGYGLVGAWLSLVGCRLAIVDKEAG